MTGKTTKAVAALVLGAGLLTVSAAGLAQEGRFYLGGSLGQSEINGFCSDMNVLVAGIGSVGACDEKDSAFKIFGGYRVTRNFAIEATYIDFGEASASGQTFGFPFSVKASATAWGAAAVGILPINNQFSLFGKAGLLMTDAKASASGVGGSFSDSESDTGLHLGLGALFDISPTVSIRAEWEREDENEIDVMSIGVQVRF